MTIRLASLLSLTRPLAVLDLETTALDPRAGRIVQVAVTIHYVHKDPVAWASLINPTIPIPNSHIHGVTDEMVKDAPLFSTVAPELSKALTDVDFCGHNVLYDLRWLRAEMQRSSIPWDWERTDAKIIDTLRIYRQVRPHTLTGAYKEYVHPDGFEDAHSADADVRATEAVLAGQLERHGELPRDVHTLAEFCQQKKPGYLDVDGKLILVAGEPTINFGKWAGTPLAKVTKGYLYWILDGDFSSELKSLIRAELKGRGESIE